MGLVVNRIEEGTQTRLLLKGDLDIASIQLLNDYLQTIKEHTQKLVIDLKEVDFVDSTGIGAILESIYLANDKQIPLRIANYNEAIEEVFEMMGIFKILEALCIEGGEK
ncbi:STAS domain-containing protein [Bacillus tianshenii]|nr:STAS domain-containing protein [Bacillus tianshenii]